MLASSLLGKWGVGSFELPPWPRVTPLLAQGGWLPPGEGKKIEDTNLTVAWYRLHAILSGMEKHGNGKLDVPLANQVIQKART